MDCKALSVRQPWAWAIIHAGKPVENRVWRKRNVGWNYRGHVLIHAGKGMTRDEYADAALFMQRIGIVCPPAADLLRGGIIGSVYVDGVCGRAAPRGNPLKAFESDEWFMGPSALVLSKPRPMHAPIPCRGALGFFHPEQREGDAFEAPLPWMTRPRKVDRYETSQGNLPLEPDMHTSGSCKLIASNRRNDHERVEARHLRLPWRL